MPKTDFYSNRFKNRTFPVTLLSDHVISDRNIGGLFRVCDAYGIKEFLICGRENKLGRKVRQTSRSAEDVVQHSFYPESVKLVEKLKAKGYYIISLEITDNSIALHEFRLALERDVILVVGDERFGIQEEILNLSDIVVHVEMFGRNSSMNVVQAANAALYEFTRQLL